MKTSSYPRWRKHRWSQLYYVHRNLWLYEVHGPCGDQKTFSADAPEDYGGTLGEFATAELAKAACEANFAANERLNPRDPFAGLRRILEPWIGDGLYSGLGRQPPDDVVCYISEIKGHGFSYLSFGNRDVNPRWILDRWRTYTETDCPRCHHKIMALLKSHRTSHRTVTGGPYVFCDCIRLNPSRLPSVSFFTENWQIALDALDFAVAYASAHTADRETDSRDLRLAVKTRLASMVNVP
jgi:hypothetical protein